MRRRAGTSCPWPIEIMRQSATKYKCQAGVVLEMNPKYVWLWIELAQSEVKNRGIILQNWLCDDPRYWTTVDTTHNAFFTLDVCVYVCVNIIVKLTLTQKMGSDPFCAFVFASPLMHLLTFDSEVDANANAHIKCEHTLKVHSYVTSAFTFFFMFNP